MPLLIRDQLDGMDRVPDIVDAADRQYDNKNTWTDAEVEKRLKQAYGDKKRRRRERISKGVSQ